MMRVAIVCEKSGVVRDAFIAAGHDAVSIDLEPTERPGPHYRGDAREFDYRGCDLAICHPECRFLCLSGVRWLYERRGRWVSMVEAAEFFRWCLDELPVSKRVVENSVMHPYALWWIGSKPDVVVQPWEFGDGYCKATALWLRGVPPLMSDRIVAGRVDACHRMRPGPDRSARRAQTYPGLARAMAEQWGSYGR